ncbi:MAG: DUF885 family protein [Candidatus Omnitrophica bacterium]|nr:DUF885 family protein [Candidatus Omnitrophota bacterium]
MLYYVDNDYFASLEDIKKYRQGKLIHILYLIMEKIKLIELSEEYFDFIALAYPVMSLSDEFYFFPRAKKAIQYLACLDSLDAEKIKQDISYIRRLKQNLEKLNTRGTDLETQIDTQLLKQSMSGFLHKFEQIKIWQNDPCLYLKIIILGIEQAARKLSMVKAGIREELALRIKQIPRLLNEAKLNLKRVPLLYQQIALQMTKAEIGYLKSNFPLFLKNKGMKKEIRVLSTAAIRSLEDFRNFLKRRSCSEEFIKDKLILENLLTSSFSYKRGLAEIFEIASNEYRKTKAQLKKIASHTRASGNWQKILSNYRLKVKNKKELLNLYSAQILRLKDFLTRCDLVSIPKMQNIRVAKTPVYLVPIRASASYSCPLTKNQKESAFFYVGIDATQENIHQEYIFVAAHETYPGHHLLDSIRRNIKNSIRQQIESALFYEGWASYAEKLIEEFGYINDLEHKLIGLRRQAWRAIRAVLDVGIRIKKIKLSDAARELCWLGYNPSRVKAMLKHYVFTYGYQLCYTIGKFEIEKLRRQFAPRMGIKNFHNCLLRGGQLPFDLIKRRMEKLCQKNS